MATTSPISALASGQRYFMPFFEKQRMKHPMPCNGGLIMVELNASSIWRYGSKAWSDVQSFPDNQELMRLLMFVLDRACTCNATVYIETLVNGVDHTTLRDRVLQSNSHVTGVRLWIPLDPAAAVVFNKTIAVAVSVAEMRSAAEAANGDASAAPSAKKRPRRDAGPAGPPFVAPVESSAALLRLSRLYFVGHTAIPTFRFDGDGAPADGAAMALDPFANDDDEAIEDNGAEDGMGPPAVTKTFVELFDAERQFRLEFFKNRAVDNGTYEPQTQYDTYVRVRASDNMTVFFPKAKVRNSGLLREVRCGQDAPMIKTASDLLKYLRSEFRPSDADVRAKIQSFNAASGLYPDLRNQTVDDLLDLDGTDDSVLKFQDPHGYSYIVLKDDDLFDEDGADSIYTEAMQSVYFQTEGLKAKHRQRLEHAAATNNSALVEAHYTQIVRDTNLLYEERDAPGVPQMYFKLTAAAKRRLAKLRAPPVDRDTRQAQELFWSAALPGKGMGLCKFITTLAVRARNMLLLLPQQLPVFVFLWLRHWPVTWNRMFESFFGVLSGPPDTGKSEACKIVASCVAPEMVWSNDAGSNLAITVQSGRDMSFHIIEELKKTGKAGTDSESDVSTKLWQSQISNGVIRYETKVPNPETGQWELQTTLIILRTCTVSNTNVPEGIAPALRSRQTEFDIVRTARGDRTEDYWNGNTAIAIRDNRTQNRFRRAYMTCLKTYSALSVRWTGLEAVGGIPHMDSIIFTIFEMMHQKELQHTLPPRRTLAVKQFAQAILIADVVSMWYTRGLGKHYKFDPTIEALFYASTSYLAPHHIVAAYTQLEQTTSKSDSVTQMLSHLKEYVMMEGDSPVVEGDYYVSVHVNSRALLDELVKVMPRLGSGIVTRLYKQIESGLTRGSSNVKRAMHGGVERIMFNRWLISSTLTLAETRILKVLYKLSRTRGKCCRGYDDEANTRVFRSSVITALKNVGGSNVMQFEELDMYKTQPQKVVQALALLEDAVDKDGNKMFRTPHDFRVARYVPTDTPGSVPSTVTKKSNKQQKNESVPLVVHVDLINQHTNRRDTTIDDFLIRFLAVTDSRFIGGPRVFAGLNTTNGVAATLDHTIAVPLGTEETVSIYNPFYLSKATAITMFGKKGAKLYKDIQEPTRPIPAGVDINGGKVDGDADQPSDDEEQPQQPTAPVASAIDTGVVYDAMLVEENERSNSGPPLLGEDAVVGPAAGPADEGNDSDDDEDDAIEAVQRDIFPPTKRYVTLNEKSDVTRKIARHIMENVVCVPAKYHDKFLAAHFDY